MECLQKILRSCFVCFLLLLTTSVIYSEGKETGKGKKVAAAYIPNLPAGFNTVSASPGYTFALPTCMAFAPDGRLFVAEKAGKVWIIQNGIKLSTPFLSIPLEVLTSGDRGITGLALDPNFSQNRYVYIAYEVNPDSNTDESNKWSFGRITRYTASAVNPNVADISSRTILLGHTASDGIPDPWNSHTIDDLHFAPDGSLLISAGDGGHFEYADGGGHDSLAFLPGRIPIDQDRGAFRAQWIGSLSGKILRLDPSTGRGLPSNPFYDGNPDHNQSKVWVYGLRNPFRYSIKPGTGNTSQADGKPGTLYIGDVGFNSWEEINVAKTGGMNFGWPCNEGFFPQPAYNALVSPFGCSIIGTTEDPSSPTLPLISWSHSTPISGTPPGFTGYCVLGAQFYTGTSYPSSYQGACFIGDYSDWMRIVHFSGDTVTSVQSFATNLGGPVDMTTDPVTGDLYYVSILGGEVRHLFYGQLQSKPVAIGSAGPVTGPLPLVVNFSANQSYDPTGSALTYTWNFGDGTTSTTQNPNHSYTVSGTYFVHLVITNAGGFSDSTEFCIVADGGRLGYDITPNGTPIALRTVTTGTGNPDITIIKDNFYPAQGSKIPLQQFTTYNGANPASDWIGYSYTKPLRIHKLYWEKGIDTTFGGWFTSVNVQARVNGVWNNVTHQTITPAYTGRTGINFQSFVFAFDTITCDGIRLNGPPGGLQHYISASEIRVFGDNRPPKASLSTSRTSGMRNLTIQFGSSNSSDPDSDSFTTNWDFGDGSTSTQASPAHTFLNVGSFKVKLTVTDSKGFSNIDSTTITVLPNNPPHASILTPFDSTFYAVGQHIQFLSRSFDDEQTASTLNYDWQFTLHHNTHTHPNQFENTTKSFDYTFDLINDPLDVYWWECQLVVSDSGGLVDTDRVYIFPNRKPQFSGLIPASQMDSHQDSVFSFGITAVDPDIWDTVSSHFVLPNWLHSTSQQCIHTDSTHMKWIFSGKPGRYDTGSVPIRLVLTDSMKYSSDTVSFALVTHHTNHPPKFGTGLPKSITAQEDTTISFIFQTMDSDGNDSIRINGVSLPSWLTINRLNDQAGDTLVTTWSLSGTPGSRDVGSGKITMKVVDTAGGVASVTIPFTVLHTNHAPYFIIQPANDSVAHEDSTYTLTVLGVDPDVSTYGDSITFSIEVFPSWLNLIGKFYPKPGQMLLNQRSAIGDTTRWTITGIPGVLNVGDTNLLIRLIDVDHLTSAYSLPIHVLHTNHPPHAFDLVLPSRTDTIDEPYDMFFHWQKTSDPDKGDDITYSFHIWDQGFDTTIAGITDTTIDFDELDFAKTYNWTVTAFDGSLQTSASDTGTITTTGTTIGFIDGWNLISLPAKLRSAVHTLFPSASSSAFGYSGTYTSTDTISEGPGYWIKSNGPAVVPIESGRWLVGETLKVHSGWNIIGGISAPVATDDIIQHPGLSASSSIFEYQNGYNLSDTIKPGKGYWIRMRTSGALIVRAPATANHEKRKLIPSVDSLSSWNTISISKPGDRNSATLYFGSSRSGINPDEFELPPVPPYGGFDARFASQRQLAMFSGKDPTEIPIHIQGQGKNIILSWDLHEQHPLKYTLTTKNAAGQTKKYSLAKQEKLTIPLDNGATVATLSADLIPASYALYQNYPNPFNPVTTISYDLAYPSTVTLRIYNILGEVVKTLHNNEPMDNGRYEETFNASKVASGVYFYQLTAIQTDGKNSVFQNVKKMILLK